VVVVEARDDDASMVHERESLTARLELAREVAHRVGNPVTSLQALHVRANDDDPVRAKDRSLRKGKAYPVGKVVPRNVLGRARVIGDLHELEGIVSGWRVVVDLGDHQPPGWRTGLGGKDHKEEKNGLAWHRNSWDSVNECRFYGEKKSGSILFS